MSFKFKQYLIIVLIAITISCEKENSISPQGDKNIFPLAIGNYWIFETYDLDFTGRNIPNTLRIDTLATITKLNNDIWEFLFNYDSFSYNEYYYYRKKQIGYLFDPQKLGINIDKKIWLKIVDLDISSFHNFDTIIPNYPNIFKNDTISARINIAINTYKMRADTGIIKNMRVYYYGYDTKIDRLLTFKYKFPNDPDSIEVTIAHLQNLRYDFAENIGLFNIRLDPSQIKITTYPKYDSYQGETIFLQGKNSRLIEYYIKK